MKNENSKKKMIVAVVSGFAIFGAGIAVGSGSEGTDTPTPVATSTKEPAVETKTVVKEEDSARIKACNKALDIAAEAMFISSDNSGLFSEFANSANNAIIAASVWDTKGLERETAVILDINERLTANTNKVKAKTDDMGKYSKECRG